MGLPRPIFREYLSATKEREAQKKREHLLLIYEYCSKGGMHNRSWYVKIISVSHTFLQS